MNLTVADILEYDFLKGNKVIAGRKGLDKPVLYVDIIEVPDVKGWIKDGGVLMTTGYAIKDGKNIQEQLIRDLVEGGASALFIKKGRYLEDIPEVIIELAEEYDLPVVQIPKEIPYKDILVPLMSRIMEKQTFILQKSRDIHDKLTRVVLEGGGIDLIAQNLYRIIDRTVLIQDKKLNIMALVGDKQEENKIKQNLSIPEKKLLEQFVYNKKPIRIKGGAGYSRVIAPVVVSGKIYGYVSVFETGNEKMEEFYYMAVQHAATVVALEMMKEKERLETRKRLEANLIEDLLNEDYKSPQMIIQRAHYLGWDFERVYVVLIIDIDNFEEYYLEKNDEELMQEIKEKIKEIVRQEFLFLNKEDILIFRSNSLVVFFDCEGLLEREIKDKVLDFSYRIREKINRQIPQLSVTIGIGNYYPEVMGLKKSYFEASKAVYIGKNIKRNSDIFHYKDLGIYRVLVKCKDDLELRKFYQEILGQVIKYDSKNGEDEMVKTIEALIKHFGNKSRAAEELCIHRNSLNYRIKKIEEVTGRTFEDSENWLDLYLALKVNDLINFD
jgi:purine catabolism regulator